MRLATVSSQPFRIATVRPCETNVLVECLGHFGTKFKTKRNQSQYTQTDGEQIPSILAGAVSGHATVFANHLPWIDDLLPGPAQSSLRRTFKLHDCYTMTARNSTNGAESERPQGSCETQRHLGFLQMQIDSNPNPFSL